MSKIVKLPVAYKPSCFGKLFDGNEPDCVGMFATKPPCDLRESCANKTGKTNMETIKYVNCCKDFGTYLEELENDQNADPGYRHIRLRFIAPGGSLHGSIRCRFCPWCGTEFKVEGHPGAVREFEVVAVDRSQGDGLRLVLLGVPAEDERRRRDAIEGGGITTELVHLLGVQKLMAGDIICLQARLDSRLVTERKRV